MREAKPRKIRISQDARVLVRPLALVEVDDGVHFLGPIASHVAEAVKPAFHARDVAGIKRLLEHGEHGLGHWPDSGSHLRIEPVHRGSIEVDGRDIPQHVTNVIEPVPSQLSKMTHHRRAVGIEDILIKIRHGADRLAALGDAHLAVLQHGNKLGKAGVKQPIHPARDMVE